MSLPFNPDQLARIRDDARRLADRTRDQEQQLDRLIATAAEGVSLARAALSHPLDVTQDCVDRLLETVHSQLQRSAASVDVVRRLSVTAREEHVAADRLLSDLEDHSAWDDQSDRRPPGHAVLVVDDYQDIRDLVSMILHNAGFVVRTASNGLEALIAAYEMRPHVIVMDVTMPVLDGIEATRLIKAVDALRQARVIAYTADPALNECLVPRLFAAVLQKPALPEVVVATVRQCASL
jgi:CheY-like chemotaxis protein